jgi:hypothetical protein
MAVVNPAMTMLATAIIVVLSMVSSLLVEGCYRGLTEGCKLRECFAVHHLAALVAEAM